MSLRLTAATTLALVLGAGVLAGPASADPPGRAEAAGTTGRVAVADLPTGEAPRVARLTGRVLHTPSGATIPVPVPRVRQNSLELLGRSELGWVVAYHWNSAVLVLSPRGRVVRRFHYGQYEEYPGNGELTLSGDGRLIALLAIDRGSQTPAVVLDLHGRKVASRFFRSAGGVLATRGRTFYVSLSHRLVAWQVGVGTRTPVRTRVDALDLAHGLLMRRWSADEGKEALVPLRHPRRARWTMSRSLAYAWAEFSPDGERLLVQATGRRVQALSTADGTTVLDLRFKPGLARLESGPSVRWEDDSHVLVEVVRGKQHTVVRCGLAGHCERTLPWQAHPLLGWDYTRTT